MNNVQGRERLCAVFAPLFFLSWIVLHPYAGIRHDGELYLAQALLHRDPAIYSQDLFFAYGSQDQYTLFSQCYAWLIDRMGIKWAYDLVCLVDQLLFISALAWLGFKLFGCRLAVWSLVCVALVTANYGGKSIFAYAEPFLTARNVAEPIALLGLGFLVNGRSYWSMLVFLVVALLQPLVSLPCLVIWWCFQVQHDSRYFYAVLGVPILAALAAMGVAPFDRLFTTFDPEWWRVVAWRNVFVIPLLWDLSDWVVVILDAVILLVSLQWLSGSARRLYVAVLIASASLLLMAVLATSCLHNTLLTGLQLWRVLWIVHLFAVASIPLVAFEYWRQMQSLALSWLLVLGLLTMPQLNALPLVGFAGVAYITRISDVWQQRRVQFWCNLAAGLLTTFLVLSIGLHVWECLYGFSFIDVTPEERVQAALYDRQTHIFVVAALAWVCFKWRRPLLALSALGAFLLLLAFQWNQRTPWQCFLLDPKSDARTATQFIKPGGQVYWSGDVLAPWVLLKTPSFYSFVQGSGVLFNRQTAMTFDARRESLGLSSPLCDSQFNTAFHPSCQPMPHRIKALCKAEQHLDLLVFPKAVSGLKAHIWTIPLPSAVPKTFYLYPCAEMR